MEAAVTVSIGSIGVLLENLHFISIECSQIIDMGQRLRSTSTRHVWWTSMTARKGMISVTLIVAICAYFQSMGVSCKPAGLILHHCTMVLLPLSLNSKHMHAMKVPDPKVRAPTQARGFETFGQCFLICFCFPLSCFQFLWQVSKTE